MKNHYLLTLEEFSELLRSWSDGWQVLKKQDLGFYNKLKHKYNLTDDNIKGDNIKKMLIYQILPELLIAIKKTENNKAQQKEIIL